MEYQSFAKYYDILMSDVPYDKWLDITKKYVNQNGYILDVGCGTGNILIELLKLKYNVTGIDISNDMLTITKDKLNENNLHANIYEQSITEKLPTKEFDAVISYLDVLNYINNLDELKTAFNNIYHSLKENGVFIFDIRTLEYFNEMDDYFEEDQLENFSYYWHVLKIDENSIKHKLAFATETHVFEEEHIQTSYENDFYVNLLENIGFKVTILMEESDNYRTFLMAYK